MSEEKQTDSVKTKKLLVYEFVKKTSDYFDGLIEYDNNIKTMHHRLRDKGLLYGVLNKYFI